MKHTYFKIIAQKTTDQHTILMAVVPNDFLGVDVPNICEMEAFKMPSTIYTGTYPQIKINTDTITDVTEKFKGFGATGILMEAGWGIKEIEQDDVMGIGL